MWDCRWYYWADKLGMLVWQDMPNMPFASQPSPQGHSSTCVSAAAAAAAAAAAVAAVAAAAAAAAAITAAAANAAAVLTWSDARP